MFNIYESNNLNKRSTILKKIVLISNLLSLSFIIKFCSLHLANTSFLNLEFLKIFFFVEFFSFIPLLFIHLYSNRFIAFIGTFLIDFISIFFNYKFRLYNPILGCTYAFCWGILPSFFLKKEERSFFKIYIYILIIFICHFFLFHVPIVYWGFDRNFADILKNNFNFVSFIERIKKIFFFPSIKTESNMFETIIRFVLLIKFFTIFALSFLITFLYIKIKEQILSLF
ncbi:hypothetical protein LFWB_6150 [Candidatus Phytoplasma luffae]|uniref:Uncharacterized protein n=1 Tax=Loofah witches'-broom phytoplasma TaxID=35773 RepID=A0A975FKL7_LOWBP|nr:hypothetical protein LFWB_6150 [Candidatus Phytoplasma luffae]